MRRLVSVLTGGLLTGLLLLGLPAGAIGLPSLDSYLPTFMEQQQRQAEQNALVKRLNGAEASRLRAVLSES